MPVALSHQGAFGFALQSVKGTFINPDTWLPLIQRGGRGPADSVQLKKNYVPLDFADVNAYQSKYFSAGQWAEGSLRFPLIPGVLSNLFSWIQDRDSYNQGKWASAVIDCVEEVKKLTDIKVRRAIFDLVKGEPVICTLQVAALTAESGTTPSPTIPTAAPYIFREATVEIATGGGGLAEDVNCEKLRIVADTALEDVDEGLRLAATAEPLQLYNLAGVRCWGAFSRDFVDSEVYADFATGTEAALTITLQRGAATAEIALPRILYTADDLGLPGSNRQRIVEKVDFLALGSLDGLTPPLTLT